MSNAALMQMLGIDGCSIAVYSEYMAEIDGVKDLCSAQLDGCNSTLN